MGKRGPKPTPTSVLRLRGSWRADTRPNEPASTGEPDKPKALAISEMASGKWDELVPRLMEAGILSRTDADTLARYCLLWAEWIELRWQIEREGSTYQSINSEGRPVQLITAAAQQARAITPQLMTIEREFGMTPSARSQVAVVPKGGSGSKASRFFRGIA